MCQLGPIFPKKSIVSLQGRDYGKCSFQLVLHFEEFSSSVIGCFLLIFYLSDFLQKNKNFNIFKVEKNSEEKIQAFLKKFTK
jgi:hypothetical protein